MLSSPGKPLGRAVVVETRGARGGGVLALSLAGLPAEEVLVRGDCLLSFCTSGDGTKNEGISFGGTSCFVLEEDGELSPTCSSCC